MAEKVTSMRLNEEDLEQFKAFAKDNGLNQQQAFNSLIALAELENAKDVLGDRAKSIDTFRETITKALGMYVNALEENTTAEQTIREELSKELQRKDNNISNLYEQLQEVKADNKTLNESNKEINSNLDECKGELVKRSKEVFKLEEQVNKLNSNNDLLQEQLQEYKQYKEDYKIVEKQLEELKVDNNNKDNTINSLDNSIQQLKDKIINDTEMLEFYKSNNAELKDSIKALEQQHKQEVSNTKEEHTNALNERIQTNTEQLQSKHDVEVAKKDLEIEKLRNEIQQLKAKEVKPRTSVKTK